MARRPPNDGASWSARELKTLKALAKAGTPTGQVAKKLGARRLRFSRRPCARASPSERRSAPEPGEEVTGTGFDSSGRRRRDGGAAGSPFAADPQDAGL